MTRVLHEADKYPRQPVIYIDEGGVMRRFMRVRQGALTVHESLVVVGLKPNYFPHGVRMIDAADWNTSPNETAWKVAPGE